jgi:hypothetical protein
MYCKSLERKGCLIENKDGGHEVNKMFLPAVTGDIVEYTFTLDMGE